MLGHDALGRLALGQVSYPATINPILVAATGAFVESGKAATFSVGFSVSKGTYTLTGFTTTFTNGTAPLQAGSFTWTGIAALYGIGLTQDVGAFTITASDVTYAWDHEAWVPRPFDAEAWTSESAPSSTWTPAIIQSETWTAE